MRHQAREINYQHYLKMPKFSAWINFPELITFTIKCVIFLLLFATVASVAIKKLPKYDDQRIKIYIKGMISNPEALIQAALLNKQMGKFQNALIDMKLALALLERDKDRYGPQKISEVRKQIRYIEEALLEKQDR